MEAKDERKKRLSKWRQTSLVLWGLLLILCCFGVWHFASAPKPKESSYHKLDIKPKKCLSCHQKGNLSCPKLSHRSLSFCFPCHLPRKVKN